MSLKVGIQMYSVRNSMKRDPVATIGKVAEMGYKYIELANLDALNDPGCGFGAKPEELLKAIEPFGAKIVSAHIDPFEKENVDKVLEYHSKLGTECLMSKSLDLTYDGILKQCELLGYLGEKCREYGIKHCVHTGAIAMYPDHKTTLDLYRENTEEGTLYFEFDTYWSLRSGMNPIYLIKKFGDRITMVHQKDLPKNYEKPLDAVRESPSLTLDGWLDFYHSFFNEEDFAEMGTGVMDIQGIVDAVLKYTSAKYLMLEQDFTKLDEFESIGISMECMKKIRGLDFTNA